MVKGSNTPEVAEAAGDGKQLVKGSEERTIAGYIISIITLLGAALEPVATNGGAHRGSF